jgi:endonuclease/exonuclease/phosphatase family metal-dependent hydrolase
MNQRSKESRFLVWNLQRQRPESPKSNAQTDTILKFKPDVAIFTETWLGNTQKMGGHEVSVFGGVWSRTDPNERKILLWSKTPFKDVVECAFEDSVVGRIVAATTTIPSGTVRVVGVCIPYHAANTRRIMNPMKMWSEHRHYLVELAKFLTQQNPSIPLVVAGDFNQRIPSTFPPKDVQQSLLNSLGQTKLLTSGEVGENKTKLIDHLSASSHFQLQGLEIIQPTLIGKTAITDHIGVSLRLNMNSV